MPPRLVYKLMQTQKKLLNSFSFQQNQHLNFVYHSGTLLLQPNTVHIFLQFDDWNNFHAKFKTHYMNFMTSEIGCFCCCKNSFCAGLLVFIPSSLQFGSLLLVSSDFMFAFRVRVGLGCVGLEWTQNNLMTLRLRYSSAVCCDIKRVKRKTTFSLIIKI